MKIIFLGDIVGRPGREALKKILPNLKKEHAPDLVLANAENIAHGQGFSRQIVQEILDAGVNLVTGGDHTFALSIAEEMLSDKKMPVLRPLNWPGNVAGRGYDILTVGAKRILIINLIGRVFMSRDFDDPFTAIKNLLEDYSLKGREQGSEAMDGIIIDFHAEATSEKLALGWFLDGRVSAVLGTHTHIPTADERILPGGTAFISDLGMVGPQNSVLGADKEIVIKRFLTQRLFRLETAKGKVIEINGATITIDGHTGLAQNIERIRKIVALD